MCQNDFCPLFFKIRSLQNKIISPLNPRNSITNSLPNLPLLAHSLSSVFVKKTSSPTTNYRRVGDNVKCKGCLIAFD